MYVMVGRDFIEDCQKVMNEHPHRAYAGFITETDFHIVDDLFDTLPLAIEQYKLDMTSLAALARLYQSGVAFGIVPKEELFKIEWL